MSMIPTQQQYAGQGTKYIWSEWFDLS